MEKKKSKVYSYTRVFTAMQIDGYSPDAQRTRMRAFAEFNVFPRCRSKADSYVKLNVKMEDNYRIKDSAGAGKSTEVTENE